MRLLTESDCNGFVHLRNLQNIMVEVMAYDVLAGVPYADDCG